MNTDDPKVRALFEQIAKLSTPEKLQLAAGLVEKGQPRLAKAIIDRVSLDLAEVMLMRDRATR